MAAFAAGLVGLAAQVEAQPEPPIAAGRVGSLAIPHSTAAVQVDGKLDDAIWREALALPLTIETYPRENQTPDVETTAYLVENGDQLLIAFDAKDPDPESIRAYLRDRDSAFNDDFVGVVLDTFNDQRRAFEFFANPFGVQMDLINDDVNRSESASWNAIWDSAGEINDRGFTVEISIPFSQLRFPRTAGEQTWGIDVLRFRPRAQRARISNNAQDRNRNCYLCQFDKFTGFANAEPGKAIEVVPTLTAARTDSRADPGVGPLEKGDFETEAGLGVRWGITPDLTLDVALNPDFSQVEADVAQLEENNTFALVLSRVAAVLPRGRGLLRESAQRRVHAHRRGSRRRRQVHGPHGQQHVGVFATNDAVTNLLFPGPFGSRTTSLAQDNDAFVGRYTRGFGRTSTIGALVTSREGDGYSNEVAGFDGRYFMNDQSTLRFQYLDSRTRVPRRSRGAIRAGRGARRRRVAPRVPLRLAQLVRASQPPGPRPGVPRGLGLHRARRPRPRRLRVQPHVLRRPGRVVHGLAPRHAGRPLRDQRRPAPESQPPAVHLVPRPDAVVRALRRR